MSEEGFPVADPRDQDIATMLDVGIMPFLGGAELSLPAVERFRAAYDFAWERMFGLAFGEQDAVAETPQEELSDTFERLWSFKDSPEDMHAANLIAVCDRKRDGPNLITAALDEHISFFERRFLQSVESLCRIGNIGKGATSPEEVADQLLSYTNWVFLSWGAYEGLRPIAPNMVRIAQSTINEIITGNPSSPVS